MTSSTDTINEQQYDAWQNQLLAEMGIVRWVSQSCPVKTFETLENLDVFFDNSAIDSASHEPLMLARPSADLANHSPVDNPIATVTHPVVSDDTADIADIAAQSSPTAMVMLDKIAGDSTEQNDRDAQRNDILTVSFALQAIVVGEWTLIVDSRHLQTDERERQLWQQITHHLRAPLHFFKFPLLADNHQLPTATAALMRSETMAVAGVSGFLFSIRQCNPKVQGNAKVGALTPLPACLDDQPIQRLPYLSEMLADYRLKRQLWQRISS